MGSGPNSTASLSIDVTRFLSPGGRPGVAIAQTSLSGSVDKDLALGSVSYADPFDGTWQRVLYAEYYQPCNLSVGGKVSTRFNLLFSVYDLARVPSAIEPIISSPLDPKIDGKDATVSTEVSAAPVLTWSAPSRGQANRYRVKVTHLKATSLEDLASFELPATIPSLRLPRGLLQVGERYTFTISAFSTSGDAAHAPYRYALPFGRPSILTGVFTILP